MAFGLSEKMRRKVRKKMRKIVLFFGDIMFGKNIDPNMIIVRFDGGFASQIAFWALARHFELKGETVKYDLSWFDEDGMDMNGEHVRNFDLPKAFADFEVKAATPLEIYRYKKRHAVTESDFSLDVHAPAYFGQYYDRWPIFLSQAKFFSEAFSPIEQLSRVSAQFLDQINHAPFPVAVHVRRGDLAVYNPVYGEPPAPEYFCRAVNQVRKINSDASFFFFSDEIAWTEAEVLPLLGDTKVTLVKGNDSGKGYIDLYLMKHCRAFIASQGAFAKFARALAGKDTLLVEPEDVYCAALGDDPNRYVA